MANAQKVNNCMYNTFSCWLEHCLRHVFMYKFTANIVRMGPSSYVTTPFSIKRICNACLNVCVLRKT
jgi:hypothetical protein